LFVRVLSLTLLAAIATGGNARAEEVPVPPLKARVTDLTGTLSPTQRATLEARLKEFEQRKGSQIAVLVIPTTKPEAIEPYSIRVAEQWKLGRKGVDDGLLVLVAKDDRKIRIEVGRGLEGVIPDAVARRVIAEVIAPYFRNGDFAGGIDAGVSRLIRLVDGEPLPPPKKRPAATAGLGDLLLFAIPIAAVFGFMMRAWFGPLFGATVTGGVTGLVFWLILGTLLVPVAAGIVAFVVTLLMGAGGRGGRGSGGGWSSGGGTDWGGGGSDGGFSGGGGDFGGGGASGEW
jgi:uncharacterized protein